MVVPVVRRGARHPSKSGLMPRGPARGVWEPAVDEEEELVVDAAEQQPEADSWQEQAEARAAALKQVIKRRRGWSGRGR